VNVVSRGPSGQAQRPLLTYKEALTWLYSLQRFGIKLGLENIQRLIAELDIALRESRIIHVAGTNGKGSVCAMIDSICRAQGYRTGLFISPHLVTFRERIRVDGEMISEGAVANGLMEIRDIVADWEPHPTFFEITTALALKYFSEANVDVVVLETGMGGRLDATNAVQSDVSVITPIDLDHEKWLGKTIAEIATEKAGIIKPKVPVVSAMQQREAERIVRARSVAREAPLQFVTESYARSPIALCGNHQKQNAALAIAALGAAKLDISNSTIVRGLAAIDWPARFQRLDERTVIDGAHNPGAARVLAETWREVFGDQRATLILAVFSDKDLPTICEALAPVAHSVLLPRIHSERAASPKELAKVLSSVTPSLPYSITPSIAVALAQARKQPHPILLTGSLHFAGELLAYLQGEPAAFEECAQ
jgi:dihydrofolate synthase/folylpolyglutamate synthase